MSPGKHQPSPKSGPDSDFDSSRTQPDDGTRQLLRGGASILGSGIIAGLLLITVLGGFSAIGAHTNGGWFALIVALACIPFGGLLLTLGVAKWFRNRGIAQRR